MRTFIIIWVGQLVSTIGSYMTGFALYPLIGLPGILLIDLTTFGIAIATLLTRSIPQPPPQTGAELETLLSKLTFGFREVWRQPSLRSLLLIGWGNCLTIVISLESLDTLYSTKSQARA